MTIGEGIQHAMSEGGSTMANRSPASNITSRYDAFLFAPIRNESGGMQLSVLSALARMNVDPWEEAARLAALPTSEAERSLVSVLDLLPDKRQMLAEAEILAARLVALLPKAQEAASARTSQGARGLTLRNRYWLALLCFAIAIWYLSPHEPATTASAGDSSSTVNAIPSTQGDGAKP